MGYDPEQRFFDPSEYQVSATMGAFKKDKIKDIPQPSHTLYYGENIPSNILESLENGETALLVNRKKEPLSLIFIDQFGTIRDKPL